MGSPPETERNISRSWSSVINWPSSWMRIWKSGWWELSGKDYQRKGTGTWSTPRWSDISQVCPCAEVGFGNTAFLRQLFEGYPVSHACPSLLLLWLVCSYLSDYYERPHPYVYLIYIRSRALSSYLSRRKVVPIPLYIINMFTRPTLRRTHETDLLIYSFCIKLIWYFLRLQNCFNMPHFSSAFKWQR